MADEEVQPEQPPVPTNTNIEAVMQAFGKVEQSLLDAITLSEGLVHDEASSLRGLFRTTLGVLRSGKPGGVSSP